MAVYVDPLRNYRALMGAPIPGLWCHLVTDGDVEELHAFAQKIGVSRRRFQNHPRHPHYDLTPIERERSLRIGAVEIATRSMRKMLT